MRRWVLPGSVAVVAMVVVSMAIAGVGNGGQALPQKGGAGAKVVALRLMPESLTLGDARDVQHVLVLGETENHERIDLSEKAEFRAGSDVVAVSEQGAVRP